MTPQQKDKRTTIYRISTSILHVFAVALLGYVANQVVPFIKTSYVHFGSVDDRMAKIEKILGEHEKEDANDKENIKTIVKENRAAIDFHTEQINTLQIQTNSNTDAIYTMLRK